MVSKWLLAVSRWNLLQSVLHQNPSCDCFGCNQTAVVTSSDHTTRWLVCKHSVTTTQISKSTTLTLKANISDSSLCHTFHSFTTAQSNEWEFTDKSASSMQTIGNFGNLLASKAVTWSTAASLQPVSRATTFKVVGEYMLFPNYWLLDGCQLVYRPVWLD